MCCYKGSLLQAIRLYRGEKKNHSVCAVPCFTSVPQNAGQKECCIFYHLKCFYVIPKPPIQAFSVTGPSQNQHIEKHIYLSIDTHICVYTYLYI